METPLTAPQSVADGLVAALLHTSPRPLLPLEAELLFYPGQYLFHYTDDAGRERWKVLSAAALRTAFSGQPVDSGWLPRNVVRAGAGPAGAFAVLYEPPGVRTLAMELPTGPLADTLGGRTLTVPLPGFVLLGLGATYWIWATAGGAFDPAAIAHQAPLPNVYADGKICWGNTRPPPAGPDGMRGALTLFFTSVFNGDLVGQKCRAYPNDVRPYLMLLAERLPAGLPPGDDQIAGGWDPDNLVIARASGGAPQSIAALCAAHIGGGGTL